MGTPRIHSLHRPLALGAAAIFLGSLCTVCGCHSSESITGGNDAGQQNDSGTSGNDAGNSGTDAGNNDGAVLPEFVDGGTGIRIKGTIRDFKAADPADFENQEFTSNYLDHSDPGIVKNILGTDGKPEYAHSQPKPGLEPGKYTVSTWGPDSFKWWFNTDPNGVINKEKQDFDLILSKKSDNSDVFTYENLFFFPIDDQLFGNQSGQYLDCPPGGTRTARNFHFTLEIHTAFTYYGGEKFSFTGDDDLWVFIDKQLVIDLGGVHSGQTATFKLDSRTTEYGADNFPDNDPRKGATIPIAGLNAFVPGTTHTLDLFFAERHVCASEFQIETSLKLAPVEEGNPDDPEPPVIPY